MIFKMLFYSKMPHHQRVFYEKKKKYLEQLMKEQKIREAKEKEKLDKIIKKKKVKNPWKVTGGEEYICDLG